MIEHPFLFSEPVYFQRFIEGPSFSAIYAAVEGRAELLGVTRQLVGTTGSPFAYRGSIGPISLSSRPTGMLSELGWVLASSFPLIGLFGVDFILRDDDIWPVEVNPRYTASVEVLELALGRSLLAEHLAPGACGHRAGLVRFTSVDPRSGRQGHSVREPRVRGSRHRDR